MAVENRNIQLKSDTLANWTTNNPTLLKGEKGLIEDQSQYVVGDGVSAFTALTRYNDVDDAGVYTEAKVSANSSVAANTAKVGITAQQASDITNNNAKRTYPLGDEQKLSGVEDNATADQTGAEIVSSIDIELGQTDWKTGGEGGASNPNVFIPTQASDFTSPDPANANKIWEIQNDITVNADCDFSTCSNVTFKSSSGKIDFGSNNVIFNNADFEFNSNDVVFDFMNATIDDTSTFTNGNINIKNFGLVGDGDLETNQGTDNRNVFIQSAKIYNSTSGAATIRGGGNYLMSMVSRPSYLGDIPNGWYLTNSATITMDNDVKVGAITSSLQGYTLLTFFNSIRGSVSGGEIVGDLKTHDFTGGVSEGCHGIAVANNSKYVIVDTSIREFSGDCICPYKVTDAIYSSASGNGIDESAFTHIDGAKAFTISENGSKVASVDQNYSKFFDISGSKFVSNEQMMIYGNYAFAGQSGFKSNTFYIAYYSDVVDGATGEFEFIERTSLIESYTILPLKDEYKNFRIIIANPDDWSELDGSVFAAQVPKHTIIKSSSLSMGVRQGISNISPYTRVTDVHFHNNGARFDGTFGSPGYHIDIEDFYQALNNIVIDHCVFGNAKNGIIILKGTKYLKFHDNIVEYATDPNYTGRRIDFGNAHDSEIYDNTLRDNDIFLGRRSDMYNNTIFDSTLWFSLEDESFRNHYNVYNIYFNVQQTDPTLDGISTIENLRAIHDKPLLGDKNVFVHTNGGQVNWFNVDYDFSGYTFNSTTNKLSSSVSTSPQISRAKTRNFRLRNISPEAYKYDWGLQWPAHDIDCMNIPIGLDIKIGEAQDITINDIKAPWLKLNLVNFPNTNTGEFSTYTVKDSVIRPIDSDYVHSTSPAINVVEKDVNLVVSNTVVDLDFDTNGELFLKLNHNGTTIFENVTFRTIKANAEQDLNIAATCGKITFIDCEFENITFTLRPGDELVSSGSSMTGAQIVEAIDNELGNEDWKTSGGEMTGTDIIAAIDTTLGQEDWKNGETTIPELLPRYDTKALLDASGVDDNFAVVDTDTDDSNGLYGKVNGVWIMLYDLRDSDTPIKRSINLVDQSNVIAASTIDATGAIVASGSEYVSQPIPVKYNNYIIKTVAKSYRLLDANGDLLPVNATYYNNGVNTAISKYLIIHKDVKFIQVVGNTADLGVTDQTIQAYDCIPYTNLTIPSGWATFKEYKRDFNLYHYSSEGVIVPIITSNLVNYRNIDYRGAYTTGVIWSGGLSTDFLPVIGDTGYCDNGTSDVYYNWWDEDKVYISSSGKVNSALSPSNAKYLTCGDSKSEFDVKNFKVVQGSYYVDSYENTPLTRTSQRPFNFGGNGNIIGDSLTSGSKNWLNRARVALKSNGIRNYSVSGYRMSTFADDINAGGNIVFNGEFYLIWLGTNDWRYNGSIGNLGDLTSATFYGSMKVLTDTIMANDADAKILMATPIQRDRFADGDGDNVNDLGHTLEDFRDAVVDFCNDNNYPCLDLYDWGGPSPFYTTTHINFFELNDYTHVNELGADLFLGYKFANFINANLR